MANKRLVTLYIAKHNITGLKYFGKTTKWFTEEDLQKHYHGSGTYWKRHLKSHGNDVTMSIYGIFEIDEVQLFALKFSEENNIKESDEWANLKDEDGIRGGNLSEKTKKKIGKSNAISLLGRTLSEEHKENLRQANYRREYGPDFCETMSKVTKGKKFTDEHKAALSKAAKNKPPISDETRKKLSEAAKRQWQRQNNINK